MVLVFPLCCVVRLQPSTTIISPFVYISSALASSKLRGLATLQQLCLAFPSQKGNNDFSRVLPFVVMLRFCYFWVSSNRTRAPWRHCLHASHLLGRKTSFLNQINTRRSLKRTRSWGPNTRTGCSLSSALTTRRRCLPSRSRATRRKASPTWPWSSSTPSMSHSGSIQVSLGRKPSSSRSSATV